MQRQALISLAISLAISCAPADDSSAQDNRSDLMNHTRCTGNEQPFSLADTALGTNVAFQLSIVAIEPGLAIGSHRFTIQLSDMNGNPVDDADFNLDAECTENTWCTNTWQYVHKHVGGSNVTVSANGNGEYSVSGLSVVHAGSWEFRFAPSANGIDDYLVLHYCIEGEGVDHMTQGVETEHSHHDSDAHETGHATH